MKTSTAPNLAQVAREQLQAAITQAKAAVQKVENAQIIHRETKLKLKQAKKMAKHTKRMAKRADREAAEAQKALKIASDHFRKLEKKALKLVRDSQAKPAKSVNLATPKLKFSAARKSSKSSVSTNPAVSNSN